MLRKIIALTLATALLGAGTEAPRPLWQRTVAKYPAPILAGVGSREYKFLVAPGGFKGSPEETFVELWTRLKEAGARQGFPVEVGWDSPFKTKRGSGKSKAWGRRRMESFMPPSPAPWRCAPPGGLRCRACPSRAIPRCRRR